jgi:hypothetical protein
MDESTALARIAERIWMLPWLEQLVYTHTSIFLADYDEGHCQKFEGAVAKITKLHPSQWHRLGWDPFHLLYVQLRG